jgi:hypothetical protein
MTRTLATAMLAALALALGAVARDQASAAKAPTGIDIKVLSNRGDLISGGDALVQVVVPAGTDTSALKLDVDGRDVTSSFAVRSGGRFMGLVTGLVDGPNVLTARLPNGSGARITITSHPIGGPVFSGPQIQPWPCLAGATDAQCNAPTTYEYVFKNSITGQFDAYDPENPPPAAEVANTTTDQGNTVPYVVRVETGAMDRGQYQVAVLFDPAKSWRPWAPQSGWNGKLEWPMGPSCGVNHGEVEDGTSVLDDAALSRGFAVTSTSLDNNGTNCNSVVEAEATMMLKEHIVEVYGPIRYTISNGCSGASLEQQLLTNDYPGLLDGIQPACSYEDAWSTNLEVQDCALLVNYFDNPLALAQGWTEAQEAAVMGYQSISPCQTWVNVYSFNQLGNPSQTNSTFTPCGVPPDQEYDAQTNPTGVRCTHQDFMVNIFGRRPQDGFARSPYDNVGVQYGLGALESGAITPAQFVDLNAKIGGHDIDYNLIPSRTEGDPVALATAYRAGLVNDGRGMATVPVIDLRGHDTEEIHEDYRSYAMRSRLSHANGGYGNQIIWTGSIALVGDANFTQQSFLLLDRWLAAIEADKRDVPLVTKVVDDKPAAATDACFDGAGDRIDDQSVCQALFPFYRAPRIVAGGPLSDDILKCQLKPLNRADYTVTFTDAQWAQMQDAFPTGVCDWSKVSQYQQPSVPWLSFSDGPGGTPLGPPPTSVPFKK